MADAGGGTGGDTSTGSAPAAPSSGPPTPAPAPDPTKGGGSGGGGGGGGGSPVPQPVSRTVNTLGGTVTATCTGSTATLTGYDPLPGFTAVKIDKGPGGSVGLTLHALVTDVKVRFTCHNGVPVATIG